MKNYEAWIDVGGTFTDCYVYLNEEPGDRSRPLERERLLKGKLLSSGRVPVSGAIRSLEADLWSLQAPELADDCDRFWNAANVVALGLDGSELGCGFIESFSDGELRFRGEARLFGNALGRLEIAPQVEAPVTGIHRLLQIPLLDPLPPLTLRLGTTKGTNALLTRRGARTALVTTAPFKDLLSIGDQTRQSVFDIRASKPEPLVDVAIGIQGRLSADGSVLHDLDESAILDQLRQLKQTGITSLAICLLHSYQNPSHEGRVKRLAKDCGFEHVTCSSEVAPLIEIVPRAQTAVVDAYLSPVVQDYLQTLRGQFAAIETERSLQTSPASQPIGAKNLAAASATFMVMTSAGGLQPAATFSGKDSILSGPAGGVAALAALAKATDSPRLIGFDMGGTSTDVCRVTDQHNLQYESLKAGVRILTPTLPIETVAAGGGSVCWFDGVSLRVGPHSAGASPGPAGYGAGGPLTITDLNIYLHRIPANQFPFQIDRNAIHSRLEELFAQLPESLGFDSLDSLARGFRRIANEQMAGAVRSVSISQGADPRQHALVGFGGAAGQHVCEIAELLGISQIYDSADAGMLSALGMGLAKSQETGTVPVYQLAEKVDWQQLESQVAELESMLSERLQRHGPRSESESHIEARFRGTDSSVLLPWKLREDLEQAFRAKHFDIFGYDQPERSIELVSVRVSATSQSNHQLPPSRSVPKKSVSENSAPHPSGDQPVLRTYDRQQLVPGVAIFGPAIVLNHGSTLCIDSGWSASTQSDGTLSLEHVRCRQDHDLPLDPPHQKLDEIPSDGIDGVFRECFAARLTAIASQMGLVLQQTAVSVNVKQRRDYSCAIFDRHGNLLANAPHVPVHLGAMSQTVQAVLSQFDTIAPGDSFITNDPYEGGSHLPDITLVTPVHGEERRDTQVQFFVACRAHHADVGGISPGSMSVSARKLGEEGSIIPLRYWTKSGVSCAAELSQQLASDPHPPRNIAENLGDIAAQSAANVRGVQLLTEFAASESWPKLVAYADHLLDAGEQRMVQYLLDHPISAATFDDHLDDGTRISVSIQPNGTERITIDFEGSGPESNQNFNANPSIVRAAVLYVLRSLIADELPLNDGVLRAVDLRVPRGVLNPARASHLAESPAVAAGNVETSQRVVDVLLGALNVAAASQGTMNNLLFGNDQFGFYETICGGAGATEGNVGTSAVHTHMTNTRLTDPEVLEANYPVRLCHFALRKNSGGAGRWTGGDGVVREIEFLQPVSVSLLTSRRTGFQPFGLRGGLPGACGRNTLIRDGVESELGSCAQFSAVPGDRLRIATPGGGGFGKPAG